MLWQLTGFRLLAEPVIDDPELLVTARHGVVSSDVDVCSQIGVDTMKKGGNAVDAAIGKAPNALQLVCFC